KDTSIPISFLHYLPSMEENSLIRKVLKLHKKSLWHLKHLVHPPSHSSEHRNEQQRVNPYLHPPIITFSPGGMSYKRYKCYRLPGWCLEHGYPSEKVAYPDYLSQRVQWTMCDLERQEKEFEQLEEADGVKIDVLPPACKEGQLLFLGCHLDPSVGRPLSSPL
uniref:Uncharacterized protein n=1 Tax=Athene cunicularia TaxID=194338 RepID=A0A663LN32_ATHCN